jgi:hypothetical protein
MQRGCEFGIDLRVAFEPGGNIGPRRYLDFADKMPNGRWPEAVQVRDKAQVAQLLCADFGLALRPCGD